MQIILLGLLIFIPSSSFPMVRSLFEKTMTALHWTIVLGKPNYVLGLNAGCHNDNFLNAALQLKTLTPEAEKFAHEELGEKVAIKKSPTFKSPPSVLGKTIVMSTLQDEKFTELELLLEKKSIIEKTTAKDENYEKQKNYIDNALDMYRFLLWHEYNHLKYNDPDPRTEIPVVVGAVAITQGLSHSLHKGYISLKKTLGYQHNAQRFFITHNFLKIPSAMTKVITATILANQVWKLKEQRADDNVKNDPKILKSGIKLLQHLEKANNTELNNPDLPLWKKSYWQLKLALDYHPSNEQRIKRLQERIDILEKTNLEEESKNKS
jgi:hypothetical protein